MQFMGDNKKMINLHEQKFNKLENFKSNIQMFQENTGASLKNLETQVGQLALNMQNQNKGAFPSDTQKNPKDCMEIHLRNGKEVSSSSKKEGYPLRIDVQKGELTLRVGDEAMHFNLNKSLEQPDVDVEICMAVENSSPISVELNSDCNLHYSINEIEMNFQYLESIDYETLPSSWQNIKAVLSLNENSQEHVCNKE